MVKETTLKLRVVESLQDDVYRGIARVDPALMKKLGLGRGDLILIKGEKETYSIVDYGYPADSGQEIIRIDGITRKNSKTGIGDQIEIKAVELKEAKKITLAPAQKGVMVKGDPDALKTGLLGRPVNRGDILVIGHGRKQDLMEGDIGGLLEGIASQMGIGMPTGLSQVRFSVVQTTPSQACIITENTQINLSSKAVDLSEESIPTITYEDIGGMKEEVHKVREMIELPLKRPEIFARLGIEPPKGVLLYGAPGTGKTLLAKAVANESEAHFITINGPEIMSKFYGESEKKIREIFDDAEKNAPSIIFIDEIDAVAPKREEGAGEVEKRVVAQLLTMMDGLQSRGKVVVIAATNRPNAVDPALRRPGRFDREVELSAPDKEGRLQILKIHTRGMPMLPHIDKRYLENAKKDTEMVLSELIEKSSKDDNADRIKDAEKELEFLDDLDKQLELTDSVSKNEKNVLKSNTSIRNKIREICLDGMKKDLAAKTHGFVGADIEALTKEAAMVVLRRNIHKFKLEEDQEIPKEILDQLIVTKKDFEAALKVVRPSAMREVLVETPDVKWDDVGGVEAVKQDLREAVEWPLKHAESFTRLGIKPPKGVLLYGPPGTGKTLLAKAVARESESNFIQIKGPSLLSMWVGKSEEGVRKIFERARQVSPCVVFFDEIDAIASRRGGQGAGHKVTENVLNQMLAEMDGIEDLSNVIVIGATNRPDILDPALMRPGRFDRIVYVPVPSIEGRQQILEIHTKNMPIKGKKKVVEKMAKETEGYTGADLESLAREAAMLALRDDIETKEITEKYFDEAMKKVRPSVSKQSEQQYKQIEEKYLKSAKAALEDSSSYLG